MGGPHQHLRGTARGRGMVTVGDQEAKGSFLAGGLRNCEMGGCLGSLSKSRSGGPGLQGLGGSIGKSMPSERGQPAGCRRTASVRWPRAPLSCRDPADQDGGPGAQSVRHITPAVALTGSPPATARGRKARELAEYHRARARALEEERKRVGAPAKHAAAPCAPAHLSACDATCRTRQQRTCCC